MAKPALGRGLGALLGGAPPGSKPLSSATAPAEQLAEDTRQRIRFVPLNQIRPCAFQPRKDFASEALSELADSIKAQGILQPLIVRERGGHFELIAGERRWRAAQQAGLTEAPVLLREAEDHAVLELALIENLQRENLNPVEEARGYAELMEKFNLRQEDVAAKVGKSRAQVANALRLLKLDPRILDYLRVGKVSVGHAKVMLSLEDSQQQFQIAESIVGKGLSVRQTEEIISAVQSHPPETTGGTKSSPNARTPAVERSAHVVDIESRIRERLGTKVQLRYRQGKGSLEVRFFSDDELERVLGILGVQVD